MHDEDTAQQHNIADSLAKLLPRATTLLTVTPRPDDAVHFVAVPEGQKLEKVDLEALCPTPRRAAGKATLETAESFIDYIKRHATPSTVVWCRFNPQTYALNFRAVFDDHAADEPGWRGHTATYEPELSHEWKVWKKHDAQAQKQLEFATFIENHTDDINAGGEGFPTSQSMLRMATEFEANGERRCKSIVRLQGGGMRLEYVDDNDAATITHMQAFDRFQIGIPVFWNGVAFRITARLRYRQAAGGVSFWYELIRPDIVHEAAAKELVAKVQAGIGTVPLLMGAF
jgi:uncharacterized protein YfdQ (DUF2303 family)